MRSFARVMGLSMGLLLAFSAIHAAEMPAAGTVAPEFKLKSQEGREVSLNDYRGKWVVLYFYPRDMTTGCTIEAHNFQRDLAKYDEKKTVILGVSVDSVDSHQQFCTRESLTFKLLSDATHRVTSEYGSLSDYKGNPVATQHPDWLPMAARNTFLIDPKGVIRKVFVKVNPMPHSEEVLVALSELQK